MTILSKLDFKSGVKSLVAANNQEIRQINAEKSNHGLKLWQVGLLVGVPSVLLAFYFIYRRNESIKTNKTEKKTDKNASQDKKNENKQELKSSAKVESSLTANETSLTADERIKNILEKSLHQQNSQVIIFFNFNYFCFILIVNFFFLIKACLEKAVQIKNLGNEYFQTGKFEDAIKCYSQAIELCPEKDKDELPKFYQNRAAAYENLVIK
jgi:tetratricopeptide (TPR) repeat protein